MNAAQERLERDHNNLRHDLTPPICAALTDPVVTEIKVSEDGKLWLRKHVVGWENTQVLIAMDDRLRALNTVASILGKTLNLITPCLSGELPLTGDRVEGSIYPASPGPSFVIRRHAPEVYSWGDYLTKKIISGGQLNTIRSHIQKRSNIVISGATDSGKTTLVNTCLGDISDTEHVIIVEDTQELQCIAPNMSRYKTGDPHPTMLEHVKRCMRRAPDRIVIGETRDKAGFELLKAYSTGHRGGLTTIHAMNPLGVFDRFAQFCEEAGVPPQWRLMRMAIDVIIQMEKTPDGRRVTKIEEVVKDDVTTEIPIQLKPLDTQSSKD